MLRYVNYFSLLDFRQMISNRESCYSLVPKNYPIEVLHVCGSIFVNVY